MGVYSGDGKSNNVLVNLWPFRKTACLLGVGLNELSYSLPILNFKLTHHLPFHPTLALILGVGGINR